MKKMKKVVIIFIFGLFFSGCEEILLEDDISQETVTILAPANNSQFFSTSVTFSWSEVQYATKYRIQIAKPNFANATEIILDAEVEVTTLTQQLNIGEYEWRVKAVNSSYETSYSTRSFDVISNDNFANNVVVLNNPVNNLITNVANQSFSWQNIIGATSYQFQIVNNSNAIVVDESLTTNSYNHAFIDGTYTWMVRASNGADNTLYTSRPILIDTVVPNTPSLVSPANASTTTETNVTFTYNRAAIQGSTEFDSLYIYSNNTLTTLVAKDRVVSPHSETISNAGTYYWKMKSFDEAGNISGQSPVFSFTAN